MKVTFQVRIIFLLPRDNSWWFLGCKTREWHFCSMQKFSLPMQRFLKAVLWTFQNPQNHNMWIKEIPIMQENFHEAVKIMFCILESLGFWHILYQEDKYLTLSKSITHIEKELIFLWWTKFLCLLRLRILVVNWVFVLLFNLHFCKSNICRFGI